MFSIILPSYLEPYKNSAKNPEAKLKRAIDSIFAQTFTDFELIVIADGCDKTVEIAKEYDLNLYKIPHQGNYGAAARNIGISKAHYDWILYCDSDDMWGENHLNKIQDGMCCTYKWFFFNDWTPANGVWSERTCNVKVKGSCGTSNIVHRRTLPIKWGNGYLHDWEFIKQLHKFQGKRIATPEYYCCHVPLKWEV